MKVDHVGEQCSADVEPVSLQFLRDQCLHVWMPDYTDANGVAHSFSGQRWEPGAPFSPFHPLFKERLDDFGILRFMQPMETNTFDVRTWNDRRDTDDARQNSGLRGPMANGMAVEYMVQLANELDADPWFNMPHMADDTYVRNFATYVRDNLEPGRTAYVEWSNEVWNTAPGFEVAPWIAEQIRLPENSGLTTWQFVGREIRRDMDVWSNVFAGQTGRIVRTVGGQAANSWVAERILENVGGSFDALAIAPYFGHSSAQLATYTADTTPAQILNDLRSNLPFGVQATLDHQRVADDYSRAFNRDIRLLAYQNTVNVVVAPVDDAVIELNESITVTLNPGASYSLIGGTTHTASISISSNDLVAGAPTVSIAATDAAASETGRDTGTFTVTRIGATTSPLTVGYAIEGTATNGFDYDRLPGFVTIPAGASAALPVKADHDSSGSGTDQRHNRRGRRRSLL